MKELQVGLGKRSYPIHIEPNYLGKVGSSLAQKRYGNRYAIVTDTNVATLYGEKLLKSMNEAGLDAKMLPFPAGEKNKNLATVGALASRLAKAGFDRHDCIVALGGGVAGDIAGFLASSYMRGIPFVQVPTTLLAQVDSSVGGKTGVDIPEGKNLVGAFYQPQSVYIDTEVLTTLPRQELLGGLAEVLKYGVIRDADFFNFLEEFRRQIVRLDQELLVQTIYKCCSIKSDVVEEDEREGGLRKILNYGHTIGHAVEAASNFEIIHGMAVAIGMVAAARLSVMKGTLSGVDNDRIYSVISAYGMPVDVPAHLNRQLIKKYLKADKKVVAGKVNFILPDSIGSTYITDDIAPQQLDRVLEKEWSYI